MASLKDLKIRIASVKSTQKITKAMKLVAASKLRRARERAEAAAPYSERMKRMLSTLAVNIPKATAPKLLIGNGSDKTHLIVAVSSDRGLCGGFNNTLIKEVKNKIISLRKQDKEVKLLCVGKKGFELLKREFSTNIVDKIEGLTKKRKIDYVDATQISSVVTRMFDNGEFDVCTVYYNKFESAISQIPTAEQIIPLEISVEESKESADEIKPVYEFEPSEESILEELLPKNLVVQIFHALLETSASEQGARMTAMDNATRNAGDMIKRLTLQYNRTRQAAITTELVEIISGAEAL